METNLEIEFKCLINAQQYNRIKNDLFSNSQGFTQTNEYLIDKKQLLKKHRWSLRVRHIHNQLEFTLKKPEGFSKLEINEQLTPMQYQQLCRQEKFESGILQELKQIGISIEDLTIATSLTTTRLEKSYRQGLLCLDLNTYQNLTDYEIEYEALNEKEGREIFKELLAPYQIIYQANCLGKMARALNASTI